jgi:hypothetical protein
MVCVSSPPVPVDARRAKIFNGRGKRDAPGQRPCLTRAVAVKCSASVTVRRGVAHGTAGARVTVDLRGRRPYVSRTPNRSHRTIGRPSRSRIPLVSGVQLHLERYRARLPQAAVAGYLPVSALLAQSR